MASRWQPGVRLDSSLGPVELAEPLFEGDGNEGAVWRLATPHGDHVAKLLFAPEERAEAIEKLLPILSDSFRRDANPRVAVPLSLLRSAREFVGILVPYFAAPWEGLEGVLFDREVGIATRRTLAADLCDLVADIHQRGFIIGDLAPGNLVADLDGGRVGIFDVDSWGYRAPSELSLDTLFGGASSTIRASKCGPDYRLPGATGLNHDTDRFALGVIVHQILTGHHPFGSMCVEDPTTSNEERIARGHVWLEAPREYRLPLGFISQHHPGYEMFPDQMAEKARRSLRVVGKGRTPAIALAKELEALAVSECGRCDAEGFVGAACMVCATDIVQSHQRTRTQGRFVPSPGGGAHTPGPVADSLEVIGRVQRTTRSTAATSVSGSATAGIDALQPVVRTHSSVGSPASRSTGSLVKALDSAVSPSPRRPLVNSGVPTKRVVASVGILILALVVAGAALGLLG